MAGLPHTDPLLDGLRTPRLVLAAPQAGDGAALFDALHGCLHALEGFPADLPWMQQEPTVDLAERYCREVLADWAAGVDKAALLWLGEEVIGWIGLQHQQDGIALLHCWGHADWQGQGLFGEALERMLALAFGVYRVRGIRMPVACHHAAGRRLCLRLGMQLQPTVAGAIADDCVLYTLARH